MSYCLICINIIRHLLYRFRYGKRYHSAWIERIHPGCRIRLFKNGSIKIGHNCEIESGCDIQVHGNGKLSIGDGTYMNRYCMVSAQNSVKIGSHCMFGPAVKIFDNDHEYSASEGVKSSLKTAPISIGNNCWLASNVVILRGTSIGDNCVIGAGCVVSGNVPKNTIMKVSQHSILVQMS